MSVKIINGIGYSENGNIFVPENYSIADTPDANPPATTQPNKNGLNNGLNKWANWGSNNLLPQQMTKDIETCGILSSIIDHQARLALGKGVMWGWTRYDKTGELVVEEICREKRIVEYMDNSNHYKQQFGWMKDQIGMSNACARLVLDEKKKQIAFATRDDVTEMRYEQQDDNGKINSVFLSAQWETGVHMDNPDGKILLQKPLLDFDMPFYDLVKKKNSSSEFCMTFGYPSWGKKYYSSPLWYANIKWVKIAQSIPEMKDAMYKNSMRPKYLITVYEELWDKIFLGGAKQSYGDYTEAEIQTKKNEVYDQIDSYLVGASNAGKAIWTDGYTDKLNGKQFKYITIEPIEDTTKNGDYLPDSAAANSEIAFSMRYNPAIIGASMPSGPYTNSQGGSNVRESLAIQVISHEPERQNVLSIYKLIKKFNGWDNIKPPSAELSLEPFIPTTILTTLDTGAGTKPVTNGAAPAKENSKLEKPVPNGTN